MTLAETEENQQQQEQEQGRPTGIESLNGFSIKNLLRAAEWSTRDEIKLRGVNHKIAYYSILKKQALQSRDISLLQQLTAESYQIISSFESKLERFWADQKSGLYWVDSSNCNCDKFEPNKVSIAGNKVLAPGIDRLAFIFSRETDLGFPYTASGKGNSKVYSSQWQLEDENARVQNDFTSAFGNTVKTSAVFSKTTPDATIKEFGGTDSDSDPSTFFYRVRFKKTTDFINHQAGDLAYSANHTTIFYVDY